MFLYIISLYLTRTYLFIGPDDGYKILLKSWQSNIFQLPHTYNENFFSLRLLILT